MDFIGIDSIPGSTPPSPCAHPDREPQTRDAAPRGSSGNGPMPASEHGHGRTGHMPTICARSWHLCWGATVEEMSRALPGDELIASPLGASTRCITVEATTELVWRHLLAYLFGTSPLRATPRAGTMARLRNGTTMQIRNVLPTSNLLLFQMIDLESGRIVEPGQPTPRRRMEWSLSFIIERTDARHSRLIVRSRTDNAPRRTVSTPLAAILDMRHFARERSMLVEVKLSAERSAREVGERSERPVIAAGRNAA